MKTRNKALLLSLCAVLLVTASVLGTMAYLTSTTEVVTNTFSVGNVKITLDEAKVDENGKEITGDDAARVTENAYHVLPGQTYDKDPTVHVAKGSEDCYLFVEVTNGLKDIEADDTITDQMKDNGWVLVTDTENVYVYTGDGVSSTPKAVKAETDQVVFKEINIKSSVDNDTLAKYEGKTITVKAYAIQIAGFEDKNAATIWAAVNE